MTTSFQSVGNPVKASDSTPVTPVDESQKDKVAAVATPVLQQANGTPRQVPTWKEIGKSLAGEAWKMTRDSIPIAKDILVVCKDIAQTCVQDYICLAASTSIGAQMVGDSLLAIDLKAKAENEKIVMNLPHGGVALAKFIQLMAPQLAKLMHDKKLHRVAESQYQYNRDNFSLAIESALLKAAVNLIRQTPIENPTCTDFLNYLGELVRKEYLTVKEELCVAEQNRDSDRQGKALQKLFRPIFKHALPNEAKDLGICDEKLGGIISGLVWYYLHVPELFNIIYYFFTEPQSELIRQKEALDKTKSGQVLLSCAKVLSHKITYDVLQTKCTQQASELPEKIAYLARAALPKLPNATEEADRAIKDQFQKSLSEAIRAIAVQGNDPKTAKIWEFTASRIEALMVKAFYNLATENGRKALNDDPFSLVVAKLREIYTAFYMKGESEQKRSLDRSKMTTSKQLTTEYEHIAQLPAGDPERDKWMVTVFQPFAQDLLQQTGLEGETLFCFKFMVKADYPVWLSSLFELLITAQPGLIDWIDPKTANAKKQEQLSVLPRGTLYISAAQEISEQIIAWLPSKLTPENAASLAGSIYAAYAAWAHIPIDTSVGVALKTWIAHTLMRSDSTSHGKELWLFAKRHLEGTLLKLLVTLFEGDQIGAVKSERERKEAAGSVLTLTKRFLTETQEGKAIHAEYGRIALLEESSDERTRWISAHFEPLARRLLEFTGMSEDRQFSVFGLNNLICSQFACWLFNMYGQLSQPQREYPETHVRLCRKLFDESLFKANPAQRHAFANLVVDQHRLPEQGQWEASGTLDRVHQIENFIAGIATPYVTRAIQTYLNKPSVLQWITSLLHTKISDDNQEWLKDKIQKATDPNHPEMEGAWKYVQDTLQVTFPKILLNIIAWIETHHPQLANNNGIPPQQHQLHRLPEKFVLHLLTLRDKHLQNNQAELQIIDLKLKEIKRELQKAAKEGREEEFKKLEEVLGAINDKLRQILIPCTKELLAIVGNNTEDLAHPFHALPIPQVLSKQRIWNEMIPDLLANTFAYWYSDMQQDVDGLRKELFEKVYNQKPPSPTEVPPDHSRYSQELANVVAQYIRSQIPAWFATDNFLGRLGVESIRSSISAVPAGPAKEFHDYLREHSDLSTWFTDNLKHLGSSQEVGMQRTLENIEEYLKPFLETMFGGLAKNVARVHHDYDSNFLLKLSTKIMEVTDEHVRKVNLVTEIYKKSEPCRVDNRLMFEKYGEIGNVPRDSHHLPDENHKAIVPDPSLQKYKKLHEAFRCRDLPPAEAKMEKFFKPLTKKMFKLMGLKAETLPIPIALQASTFDWLQNTFGPIILRNMYEQLLSRSSLKEMQISFNTNLMEGLSFEGKGGLTEAQQKEFELMIQKCGSVLRPLLDWMPQSLANALITNFEGVKKMAEQGLGSATVGYILDRSMLDDIVAKLFRTGVRCMHEGEWGGEAKDRFTPGQIVNGVFLPSSSGRCNFPKLTTRAQKEAAAKVAEQIAAKRERIATEGSIKLGNKGVDLTIANTRHRLWENKIVPGINFLARKIFGRYSGTVSEVLQAILTYIIKFFEWVFYPLYRLVVRPIQTLHVSRQVQTLERNLSIEINENLIMQMIDLVVDEELRALDKLERKAPPSPTRAAESQLSLLSV